MRAVIVTKEGAPLQAPYERLPFGVALEASSVHVTLQPNQLTGRMEPALVITVDVSNVAGDAVHIPWIPPEAFV